jgi:hypothetical protein
MRVEDTCAPLVEVDQSTQRESEAQDNTRMRIAQEAWVSLGFNRESRPLKLATAARGKDAQNPR